MLHELHPLTDDMRERIKQALKEDIPSIDATSSATVPFDAHGEARFIAKAGGVLAGIDAALEVFRFSGIGNIDSTKIVHDGALIRSGDHLATVAGPLHTLLAGERTALNLLQRMSGIATTTKQYVEAVRGTQARILDTRKTAPLLRPFDRYAVRAGGAENHRYSLSDMILVKDNHIAANKGNLQLILEKLHEYFSERPKIPVEIEVTSLDQFSLLLLNGRGIVDRVMFDNFAMDKLREGVIMNDGLFQTEASGGVTLESVRAIAETGVNYISVGALTHSVRALDISLEM